MVMLDRRHFLAGFGAGACVWLVGASSALAEGVNIKSFLAAYHHVGGDKEREARDRAIEDAISTMSSLFKGVARDMLKSANGIPSKLEIKTANKKKSLTVMADDQNFTAPLDGTAVKVKVVTGDVMQMHYEADDGQLDQIFEGEDRGRLNRFTFNKAGQLLMNVTVHATQLPKKLVYKLTYERN